ncbi:hypothetical protein E6H31_08350 [Candidatus Bathyarchaeota archaeon]|nr:MAG: hypothetical protein E6H31_08350 [Candidatus Bathyarchaeota archaeon]
MSRFRRPLPSSPDDARLLEVASGLGQQLDLPGLNLRDIRWMEWIPVGRSTRSVPSDWCMFLRHSMVLPARMMGKLTVEEWRPVIASSLVFEKKIRRSMRGTAFLLTRVPLIVSLGGTITAAILLQMSWIIFLYPVLLFPLAILGGRRYDADLKRARLEADSRTSSVIGKDPLLQVMKKIDLMGLDDVDRLKSGRGGRRLASLPSITERIDNLQGLSSLAGFSSI